MYACYPLPDLTVGGSEHFGNQMRVASDDSGQVAANGPAAMLPRLVRLDSPSDVQGLLDLRFVLTAVDGRGRCAAVRPLVGDLGWLPGQLFHVVTGPGVVVVGPKVVGAGQGVPMVTGQGCLRLGSFIRRRLGLVGGERMLFAADLPGDRLFGLTAATLSAIVIDRCQRLGEQA